MPGSAPGTQSSHGTVTLAADGSGTLNATLDDFNTGDLLDVRGSWGPCSNQQSSGMFPIGSPFVPTLPTKQVQAAAAQDASASSLVAIGALLIFFPDELKAAGALTADEQALVDQALARGVETPRDGMVLYSGPGARKAAMDWAEANGKYTIYMTPGGRWLNEQNLYARPGFSKAAADRIWGQLSENFVHQARERLSTSREGHKLAVCSTLVSFRRSSIIRT